MFSVFGVSPVVSRRTYVEHVLAPTPLKLGDIVVIGNLSSHKGAEVRRLIEARRGPSVPPPYSPDLNPLELAFAKLKALLRKAAERSVDDLWSRIGSLLDAFTPDECRNYFRHAGYA